MTTPILKRRAMGAWPVMAAGLLLAVCIAGAATASPIVVTVGPDGDGNSLEARYGFFDSWNEYAFQSDANPVQALHEHESGYGTIKIPYLQFSLAGLPQAEDIEQATLNLYITEIGGNGAKLKHRTDSAGATGQASQELGGNVDVMAIGTEVGTGWLGIDVTEYIQSDLGREHAWAVFSLPSNSYSKLSFYGSPEANFAPNISIETVPEPASLSLLVLGGVMLLRRRR